MQLQYESSNKALNYYWGMSAGVIELIYSKNLPNGVRKLAQLLESTISSGIYNPFCGPLKNQSGEYIDMEGKGLPLESVITMDWLLENIVGTIPEYELLSRDGKATVESAGAPAIHGGIINENSGNC
jgi:hypothetical protein